MMEIMKGALLLLLFAGAAWDAKQGEIPTVLLFAGLFAGIFFHLLFGFKTALSLLAGCLPGGLLLFAGFVSNQAWRA